MTDTTKSLRVLQVWVSVLTLLVLALLLALGYLLRQQPYREPTAERINIVEPDGQLKLVNSGNQRQHPGMLSGRPLPTRERGAGLVFFNEAGDDCGGLLYNGNQHGVLHRLVSQRPVDAIAVQSAHAGQPGGQELWPEALEPQR